MYKHVVAELGFGHEFERGDPCDPAKLNARLAKPRTFIDGENFARNGKAHARTSLVSWL